MPTNQQFNRERGEKPQEATTITLSKGFKEAYLKDMVRRGGSIKKEMKSLETSIKKYLDKLK